MYVGGSLVATFSDDEPGLRNVTIIQLAADPRVTLGKLADAFELTAETLRQLRRAQEQQGLDAVWGRRWGGSESKVTPRLRAKLERMFEQGMGPEQARKRLRGREKVSVRTVRRVRADWRAKAVGTQADEVQSGTLKLPDCASTESAPVAANDTSGGEGATQAAAEEGGSGAEDVTIATAPMHSAKLVQHAGTWLMMALVHRMGLYVRAEQFAEERVTSDAVRIALDAVIAALAIGQACVEGVRRLATPSGPALLRCSRSPSASWARRTLGLFSQWLGGLRLHAAMAAHYAHSAAAVDAEMPIVFYVDNHMRPYTGKETIRKGWRMQDKHVVPGVTDYYVHDVDGRPLLRIAAPHHGSLTSFLTPIAQILRELVGPEPRILLAFDRAGSFPAQMAELRDAKFEFVTYERRPYPILAATAFTDSIELGDELVQIAEPSERNLRAGRGRVRRIVIRKQDESQVNLLAVSAESAERLVGIMKGRWNQENGFKQAVERWGANQLDGRSVETYPPHTLIPNPARRRLDVALRAAQAKEGEALCMLSRLAEGDPKRQRYEQQLADARAQRADLEALRPSVPKHAPLCETELAGKLVRHVDEYKITIDTIRIACANAEADLAGELAPHLIRPMEAKKVLANLFAAPARVHVTDRVVDVALMPAANGGERRALNRLLDTVNDWKLTLPGDGQSRPLRFRLQT